MRTSQEISMNYNGCMFEFIINHRNMSCLYFLIGLLEKIFAKLFTDL